MASNELSCCSFVRAFPWKNQSYERKQKKKKKTTERETFWLVPPPLFLSEWSSIVPTLAFLLPLFRRESSSLSSLANVFNFLWALKRLHWSCIVYRPHSRLFTFTRIVLQQCWVVHRFSLPTTNQPFGRCCLTYIAFFFGLFWSSTWGLCEWLHKTRTTLN